MVQHYNITLPSHPRGFHIINDEVLTALPKLPDTGYLQLYIQHTSAGLTINENADPDVRVDFENIFNKIVPENLPFLKHTIEGPDDMPAHVKASMVGFHVQIPIVDGRLALGTWQGIYLCEFRNSASRRRLVATLIS